MSHLGRLDDNGSWQPDDAKTVRTARVVIGCALGAFWAAVIGWAVWG